MLRTILEIILISIIVFLLYSIITGQFCACSTLRCPSTNSLRSYLT